MQAQAATTGGRRRPWRIAAWPFTALGRRLVTEADRVTGRVVLATKRTRTTGSVALVSALGLLLLHWAIVAHPAIVERVSGVRAELPLRVEVWRLPGSMLAPAPRLPLWGALGQVIVVFWLAELNLGRRLTLVLALLFHAVATLSARVMVHIGPKYPWHLGVKHHLLYARDTGPSAAVVGLCAYLSIVCNAPLLGLGVWLAMIGAVWWHPDLAGREHLVAMAVGTLAALPVVVQRCWAALARRRAAAVHRRGPDRAPSPAPTPGHRPLPALAESRASGPTAGGDPA